MSNRDSTASALDRAEVPGGVAIIGLAGRFPAARTAGEFWQNLAAGRDCLTRLTDEELTVAGYDAAKLRELPGYVPVRGMIDRPEWFDRAFFAIPPKEAEAMDPQQRVFMEVAWEALEDAGCDPSRYPGLIGVFAGMSNNTYFANFVRQRRDLLDSVGIVNAVISNEKDFLATRLAYKLDLRGPALNIQTACSSSLVSVAVACQQLLEHQCDAALAGGVSITFPQARGYFYQEGGMTSGDGWCRPFDQRANGTIFSSGAGVVVLKRLEEALAEGDQIYAVIRGQAVNNDGAKKVSFAAPSIDGQAEVIALAQALAGVSPESISYIEAHGTATPLGDPIEVAALAQVFRAATERRGFCALGSVKGNLGHMDAASGVGSLIKTALAFRHEALPPTIHCEEPNPALHLGETAFVLHRELQPWPRSAVPRRAGVNSLGVGGTNAHLVLEEAPERASAEPTRAPQVLVLSAKTATALAQRAADLAQHLEAEPEVRLADVAFTLQTGRQLFAHRRMVVARDAAQAVERLRAPARLGHVEEGRETPVAFLFPGQGAQYAKMGMQLYAAEPAYREALDRCATVLEPMLAVDLRALLSATDEAAVARLRETRLTQPAIFAVNYALAQFWLSLGVQPAALVGHSVGEFVAATIAGVFTLEDAARLVAERARLVQDLPRGAMLAVRMNEAEAGELTAGGDVDLAAVNSPRLCVLAGPFEAIERVEKICAERSIPARRLETSHAFHSAMVEPVVTALETLLTSVPMRPPTLPILSTVTGEWLTPAEATSPRYWAAHARATVRFSAAAARLLAHGSYACLEAGPGQGLTQLARQQEGKTPHHDFIPTIFEGMDETEQALSALGRLWAAGVPIDWRAVHSQDARMRVSLPAYPFERQRYFADLPAGTPLPYVTAATDGESPVEAMAALAPALESVETKEAVARVEVPLLAQIKQLLSDLSGLDIAAAEPGTSLLELGFDSLFLTQIALALRKKFAVKMTLRQLMADLSTLDALAEYIGKNATGAVVVAAPVKVEAKAETVALEPKRFGPFKPIETGTRGALTDRQQAHLDGLIARYSARFAESKRLTQASRAHLADPRTAGSFNRAWKEMVFPIVVERSEGARIWDVDGNEWIDLSMGFGTNLLGHAPAFIKEALAAQLERGIEVGPQTPLAGKTAKLIAELVGMDRVAFCNTGSEAVMAAVRMARTVTGRSRIATTSGFHGINDEVLVRSQVVNGERRSVPVAPGIPEHIVKDVLVLEYGTPEALELLRQHAHELAAVLIEPVQSRRLGLQPREWLHEVRKITAASETALIFDELITGFRSHPGGMQNIYGVRADIATYGKVIGGGIPIGVVAGSATYMDALDGGSWQYGDDSFPEVGVTFFAGTYVRHPLAIAGAWAMANYLREQGPQLQERLNERTAALARTLNDFLAERGVPLQIQQFASILYFQFEESMKLGSLLYFHLREKGVHLWEGRPFFLSTAHTEADVQEIIRVFQESVIEMQRGGLLPEPTGEIVEAPVEQIEIAAQARVPETWAPAARKAMAFSLYYFGSYPAAYDPEKYRLVIEGAKFADTHGFEAVWVPERHFHSVGGFSPNPSVVAAALARETSRVQLRGGSVVLPLHHPVRVAEEWSVVDNLSGGRVGISIASGWHPNDFVLAPERFVRRRELCSEGVETIQKLWRGETVNFPNAQGNEFGVKLHPMPKQASLPVWLTCIHAESYAKAGEMGVSVLGYLMNQSVEELAEKIRLYRSALVQHGHDPAIGHVTVLMLTHLGGQLQSTVRRARGPMREYLRSYLDNKQKRLDGSRGPVEIDQDDVEALLDRSFEDYVAGKALIGTPESCAPVVEKLAAIGVDEIGCFIDFGVGPSEVLENLPHLDALRSHFANQARETELPLTASQAGMYSLTLMGEEASRAYGESTTLVLRGPLDVAAMQRAVQSMPARHEGLRTVVTGETTQRVLPEASLEVPLVDFSQASADELKAFLAAQETAPFDFVKPPLMRAVIVKLAPEHHALVLTFHHLLGNGPSYTVLVNEVIASYGALHQGELPKLGRAMQLSEFVAWQQAQVAEERFWLEQLSGELPTLELPVDRPRPRLQSFKGGRAALTIDRALTTALRQMAVREKASLFMVVFSAYTTLLHRLSGQSDVIVGVPFEGEARSLEGGHALYANTTHMMPLRSRITSGLTFAEYLGAQKQLVLDASEQQNFFFGHLLDKVQRHRDPSRPPLFSAIFNFENGEFHRTVAGLEVTAAMETFPHRTPVSASMFELNLNVAECAGELVCQLDHAEIFDTATAQRWLGHFQTLLEEIAAHPETRVTALPMLGAGDRARMLEEWNATDWPEGREAARLHALFEAQVQRTPDAVAVISEEETVTYAELNRRANRLARRLRQYDVGADRLVGVCLGRSVHLVTTLLAVLKAGGAYVPLDPSYPAERLAYMVEDARMPVIVSHSATVAALGEPKARVLLLDRETLADEADDDLAVEGLPEDLAYVIYTSGSTGRPKGVMIPHGAVCHYLRWMQREFPLDASDRVLQKTPVSFDASVWEFYAPLLAGARLVMARPEGHRDSADLTAAVEQHGVTILQLVPSMLGVFLEESNVGRKCRSLRRLFAGGEALPAEVAARFFERMDCELVNLYGPTECTVYATFHRCRRGAAIVPIGWPITNTQLYILDENLEPVPQGVTGQLHIGGVSLGRGYLNKPELTEDRFIQWQGHRLYKTGDLTRWLPGGEVEYLGRADHQVKLRGFRIETSEVESAIRQVAKVGECKVTLREISPGERQLIAYVTRNGSPMPSGTELRAELARLLPEYMLPAAFLEVSRFPLNANGKLALDELPLPADVWDSSGDYLAAQNTLHAQLAEIWQDVLGRPNIGIRDDFFELGGHSLLAVRMLALVEERLGVRPALSILFEKATIEHLAASLLDERQTAATSQDFVALQTEGTRTPFFFFHGDFGGGGFFSRALARELGSDRPFYAVHPHGLRGDQPPRSISVMAADRLQVIRENQPEGPYLLGGYCNGALVAFEVARMLEAAGERVPAVVLLMADASTYRDRHWQRLSGLVSALHGEEGVERDQRFLHWRRRVHAGATRTRRYLGFARDFFEKPFPEQSRRLANKLRQLVAPAPASSLAEPAGERFWDVYHEASESYVPQPFGGRLILLWPEEEQGPWGLEPTYGWEAVSPDVRLVRVPGDHDSSITRTSSLAAIGREMRRALEAAETGHPA